MRNTRTSIGRQAGQPGSLADATRLVRMPSIIGGSFVRYHHLHLSILIAEVYASYYAPL